MKAININGEIKTYSQVPSSWNNVIGNFNLLTDDELKEYGFYDLVTPNINTSTHVLGDIYFNDVADVYTYQAQEKTWSKSLEELKTDKIINLKNIYNKKLSETDWYVIRSAEAGTAIPANITTERNTLRTACGTKESEINSLSTKAEVEAYNLPSFE